MEGNKQQALILIAAQARAVYSAMCTLSNVSAVNLDTVWRASDGESIRVMANNKEGVLVRKGGQDGVSECYADQAAFAAAYRLDAMRWPADFDGVHHATDSSVRAVAEQESRRFDLEGRN